MNRVKSAFFAFLAGIIMIIASCKKDDQELKSAVSLVLFPTQEHGITGQDYNYTFSGAIISPQKVDMNDYGFRVVNLNGAITTDEYISLAKQTGDASKVGRIETSYTTMVPLQYLVVSMYVVLEDGDTITSKEDFGPVTTPPAVIPPPVVFVMTSGHSTNLGEVFTSQISNADTVNYSIVEYGIEYNLSATYVPGTFSDRYPFYSGFDLYPTIAVNYDMNPSSAYFTPETEYVFRIYAIVESLNNGSQYLFYNAESTFISLK